ncbi:unnamed protein product [Arabidopsis halleri]
MLSLSLFLSLSTCVLTLCSFFLKFSVSPTNLTLRITKPSNIPAIILAHLKNSHAN